LISAECIISRWWWRGHRGHPRSGGKFPLSLFAVSPTSSVIFLLCLYLSPSLCVFSVHLCTVILQRSISFIFALSLSFYLIALLLPRLLFLSSYSIIISPFLVRHLWPCNVCLFLFLRVFCQAISLFLSPLTFLPFLFIYPHLSLFAYLLRWDALSLSSAQSPASF
jgi:hypothetical protein